MINKYARNEIEPRRRPIIRGEVDGRPVYEFGYASIISFPPEITEGDDIQHGNTSPKRELELKASWEITDNYIGVCTTRSPRLPENDFNGLHELNLIDGNPLTCWSSRPHRRSDGEPVWIRIDLAREQELSRIVLKKRPIHFDRSVDPGSYRPSRGAEEIGRAMARKLTIKASRDAYSWDILFDGTVDTELEEYEFAFLPMRYKQIVIIGD